MVTLKKLSRYRHISMYLFLKSKKLFSLLFVAMLYGQAAHSETIDTGSLAPIISIILNTENQCSEVTQATTVIGDQIIETQEQLNALKGTTKVDGNLLFLRTSTLTDFTPLDSLIEVTQTIRFAPRLLSEISEINGFNCLEIVGGNFSIISTENLERVSGFKSLKSVEGNFRISFLPELISISGFDSLTTANGGFELLSNPILTSIPNFSLMAQVNGTLNISDNRILTSLTGFDRLTHINGDLLILDNFQIVSTTDFESLVTVTQNLKISGNTWLNTIGNFKSLETIGGSLEIREEGILIFGGFPPGQRITNINGFNSLTTIGEDLLITGNRYLTSIAGFTSLNSDDVSGTIRILTNSRLDCSNPEPSFVPVTDSFGNQVNCTQTIEP